MNLTGRQLYFKKHTYRYTNPYAVLFLLGLVLAGLFIIRAFEQDVIVSPFKPTHVPTRISLSFAMEGQTRFVAGDLNGAIAAYGGAVRLDPLNAQLWAELARIQAYSSQLLSTDAEKRVRLEEGLKSVDQAVLVAPDYSLGHAIRAMVLDWLASPALVGDRWQNMLVDAEQAVMRALQLDNQNVLAMAYYAEILVDEQRLLQSQQYINQALAKDNSLMDVHRVNAYVLESLGYYGDAIRAYELAAQITPNMTFLYIRIGANYRYLKQYDRALEYFAKAANINEQINAKDPIPYLAIGRTYTQLGEFFAAARNVRKALEFDPTNPDVYGTLGMIYFKSRNYETAIVAFKCAVYGCNATESCEARQCDEKKDPQIVIQGMPLTSTTVVYYYSYGSVLAGMHRPKDNYCPEAVKVLAQVRAAFANDSVIMEIIQTSEDICRRFGVTN